MRRFRARSGPFEEQLSFSPKEIDSMCVEALQKAELLPSDPQPIRIDWFIEKYFRCVVSYGKLGDGVLGCTAFRKDGSVAGVMISQQLEDGSKVSGRRVRTTLAHEGGHCLMHPSLFMNGSEQRRFSIQIEHHENLDFKERRILCRNEDVRPVGRNRGYNARWWEWQANRAIGGFLLPLSLARKAAAPFIEETSVMKSPILPPTRRIEAERELACIFDVNPIVARIRLRELFQMEIDQMEL
jgi:hypothetical protein